ncbi:MAG: anaerobic sulfatase maturase, partial [Spirochaetales bacterium]|nr:anaerobic sulfatase maturase [Spirochaetales bacterium]
MSTKGRDFSLLIKPAGADCNLRCSYCFYLKKSALYPETPVHRISDPVLERVISSYMRTKQDLYAFGWQGGEPTLMGLGFFQKVVRLQQQYGNPGAAVSNGLQTNGTLLTDEMADFFTRYHFLLGVSLDGPENIHDRFRMDAGEEGSYKKVMRGIRRLRRRQTEFNILSLVSKANVNSGREVYDFLKSEGFFFHQYIPCVERDEAGNPLPWSISGEEWGRFLLDVFSRWYPGDTVSVSLRHFDSVLNFLVYGRHNVCFMSGSCNQYFLVEHSGDVYPCDFFAQPDLKLGNVLNDSWQNLLESSVYRKFGAQKSRWNPACGGCEFLPYCGGDCLKHRPGEGFAGVSSLCEGWKMFYRETLPVFKELAKRFTCEVYPKILPPVEKCYCG